MSFVEIAQENTHISSERGFLLIHNNHVPTGRIPFDLIDAVIITARGVTHSNPALVKLCEKGIPVILCGKNFQPAGIITGINIYHKQTERLACQINADKPFHKKIWKHVVQQKIRQQERLLAHHGVHRPEFPVMIKSVRSGDPDNIEAQAARLYWNTLFGEDFIRDTDAEGQNSFLNYGYAVIRSAVARYVVATGLSPSIGIHHRNKLNPFCLVDDLMEPFRPAVDNIVYTLFSTEDGIKELSPKYKRILAGLLESPVAIDKSKITLQQTVRKYVLSFVHSLYLKNDCLIKFNLLFKNSYDNSK
ncbi:MAG: type II CRISPR-associated endonuclease Cas1 [Candidatus Auribacterota bacterium]|jgi:CRISPR-associated protein Cas1|nr:type II CRISPR-associated endonuclease Cas1 [Candidatus Auribacterota bacterium]